jgi:DNA modification methylase
MIIHGDSLIELKKLEDNSVDSIVSDPPYGLAFMGKKWDYDVPSVDLWRECLRVLKPGGHLLSFGGTRTYHRMVVAIEDAGFEIRDQIQWLYGSGFPKASALSRQSRDAFCQCASNKHNNENKSHEQDEDDHNDSRNVSACDDLPLLNAHRLKNKPLNSQDDCQSYHDLCGAHVQEASKGAQVSSQQQQCVQEHTHYVLRDGDEASEPLHSPCQVQCNGPLSNLDCLNQESPSSVSQENISLNKSLADTSQLDDCKLGKGQGFSSEKFLAQCQLCGNAIIDGWYNGGLKPANEPICLARKPLSESTVAKNVLKWGVGGINVDGCRIEASKDYGRSAANAKGTVNAHNGFEGKSFKIAERDAEYASPLGRFPANLLLDEVAAEMLDAQSGVLKQGVAGKKSRPFGDGNIYGTAQEFKPNGTETYACDTSSGASRFFYVAKASKRERNAGCEGMPTVRVEVSGQGAACPKLTKNGRPNKPIENQNHHPTVKPVTLMRYLCRLITPPNGTVLDPFCGSGTTGVAAKAEGFNFIGIEREAEYVEIAKRRYEAGD